MRFGFQISIAGGLSKVVNRAKRTECETIQLFSRNPRSWQVKPTIDGSRVLKGVPPKARLPLNEVDKFKQGVRDAQISPIFIHMPYLPNLSSPNDELWAKSVDSLCLELETAEWLDALAVIIHPGHHMGTGFEKSIDRAAQAINLAFNRVTTSVLLLIENTAGEGSAIGYNFSHIKSIFDRVNDKEKLGVCIDTAHLYQAGYNIATLDGLKDTVAEFYDLIGLNKLHLLHLNDSKTPLGSHKDKHWHIGEGYIGVDGFKNIINLPIFSKLPGIMETPRQSDKEDIKNMNIIKRLASGEL